MTTPPKPGTLLRSLATGRCFTVVKKTEPKNGYSGGLKVVHLKGGHIEMSVRAELLESYFTEVQ
jgi:hypothetical protein